MLRLLYLTLVMSTAQGVAENGYNPNKLLENYDPKMNPYYYNLKTVVVNISTPFVSLGKVMSDEQMATLFYAVNLTWPDERLRFDPAQYGNNSFLYLPTSSIWTPRYTIFNARSTKVLQNGDELDATITKDGIVTFTQIFFSKVDCEMRFRRFPFDKFFCGLRLLNLDVNRTITRFLGYKQYEISVVGNIEFELQSFNVCSAKPELFIAINDIYFMLQLQRDTFYYHFVIVLPATLVTMLTIVGALLPKNNNNLDDTIHVGMAALLALSITFSVIADNIPRTNTVPLIGWFVIICLLICLISIFFGLIFAKLRQMIKKRRSVHHFTNLFTIQLQQFKSIPDRDFSRFIITTVTICKATIVTFFILQGMMIANLIFFFSFAWNRDKYTILEEKGFVDAYDVT